MAVIATRIWRLLLKRADIPKWFKNQAIRKKAVLEMRDNPDVWFEFGEEDFEYSNINSARCGLVKAAWCLKLKIHTSIKDGVLYAQYPTVWQRGNCYIEEYDASV